MNYYIFQLVGEHSSQSKTTQTVKEDYRNNKVEVGKEEVKDYYDKEEKNDYDSLRPKSMAGRFFNSHRDSNQDDDNNNVC